MTSRTILRCLPAGLLFIHAALLAYGAAVHSPAIDEVGHLSAGLSHWQLGRFDLYHVNPPLVRAVAAIPILFAQPKTDWSQYSDAPGARSEFPIGRDLITNNGERSFWFFTWARWACIPFSLLGAYVCFRWARDLYGPWSGLLALTLWCFEPNILANAQMITPDTGATALGLTAAYVFWKWLKSPSWPLALSAGLVLGLTLLTKSTWIILFGLWPALWLLWQPSRKPKQQDDQSRKPKQQDDQSRERKRPDTIRTSLNQIAQLGTMFLLALYLLNMGYGFEGSFERLGDYRFVSETLAGPPQDRPNGSGNRFTESWLGAVPMPVPRNYLLGIDVQKHDFESHFYSYLRGVWQKGGWWYYYLYGLTVKVPLGVWILGVLAAALGLFRRGYTAAWRDELTLLAPAVVVLTLVSAETGFSHHLRYVLPIFPFAFIWMSKAARAAPTLPSPRGGGGWGGGARLLALLTGGAAAWAVVSSLLVFPHSLSYFNELAGGPENGSAHLLDSNIDWGQDVLLLRDWLKEHPEARPLHLAYFGYFDPRVAGIEFTLPPKGPLSPEEAAGPLGPELGPQPGWYAVSVTMRGGYEYFAPDGQGGYPWFSLNSFTYFQRFRPVAHLGWSIYIYHITREECAQVRQEMALPEIK